MKKKPFLTEDAAKALITASPILTKDPRISQYLEDYSRRGKRLHLAKFRSLKRGDREHRISNQVVKGFPYTSEKYPWPTTDNGSFLQPLIQLDLSNASVRLSKNLGEGLLQVWANAEVTTLVQRLIPVEAMLDSPSNFYKEDAGWLDPERVDFLFPNHVVKWPRIEWWDAGIMFPAPFMALDALSEEVDEAFQKSLLKLGIRISSEYSETVQLGGYPWAVGNESMRVDYEEGGRRLLHCLRDGQGMFTVQVTYTLRNELPPEFEASLIYM